ncbi:MAG TPA: DUF4124 domain-containing protein [Usitatibacteraceae bacterium]|nr:DUF4124 domain-containing protein [Usitatibacteraceae bacterium]
MKILVILAMLAAPAAHAVYKCKDEKGITHVGDTPPAACANVVLYEIAKSGNVIRTIDPTPTGDQVRAKTEEAARRKEAEKAAAEQRRKDIALLATYSSEQDIDTSRDLNLKPIEGRIQSARERTLAVEKRTKELETELEFYKAGKGKGGKSPATVREAPPQLKADLEQVQREKASLAQSITNYGKEMQEVRERYDADKKRWVELKQMNREGKFDLRDSREIEASRKTEPAKQPARK